MKKSLMVSAATALATMPRAVAAMPRADAADPKAMFEELQKAVKAMRDEQEKQLGAKVDDTLFAEKIDGINAEVTRLENSINEVLAKNASSQLGDGRTIRDPEYSSAFASMFRKGDVQAALTKGTDADGGYLAPVEWDRTIQGRLKQISPIRENATVITIGGATYKKLYSDRNVGSGWVGETAARPATSTPQLGSLDFPIGEIYANPAASQQLLDDAEVDIEAWLAGEVEYEFARQENIAFLSGDGANKPYGLLTYVTGATNAARHPWGDIKVVNSGAAATIPNGDAMLSLFYELPVEYRTGAKLFTNQKSVLALRKLKDNNGQYLWQPSLQLGQPATLAGVEIVDVPAMPDVAANAIAALYGNMAETYHVIDRMGVRVLRDPYTNKPFVHFYTTKRVGGGVNNPDAMKALKISA